jgi:branched-chain amino acid transport system ATP-binding protein
MSGGAELEVRQLSKSFGGVRVLEDVNFHIASGEVLGVVGPNGAGKTTLINVIAGRVVPTGGKVLLDKRDVTGRPTHLLSRAGVGRSFQQTNTFRTASVGENIARAIRFAGAKALRWDEIMPLLQRFDLGERLDEQSDKLPYGLQKMLGLVMVYVTGARLLLLDEPAAGLERGERQRIDDFVQHAQERNGCSVLIVEHDIDLIRRLCPRIVMLDVGRIMADGPPAEVFARPDVIAAYVGAVEAEGDPATC